MRNDNDMHAVPCSARIVERVQDARGVFSLSLELADPGRVDSYRFHPGQFNMLSVPGVGEVAISIVSDPDHPWLLKHTIREVGRVTRCLSGLQVGEFIGIRGPFGRGWPLRQAYGQDVLLVTGGLGCAPVVSVIHYILRRWTRFGRLIIMQGVKHANDLIWRQQYETWQREADVEVFLAADVSDAGWPWHQGLVTTLFDRVDIAPARTVAMMCGPEVMMQAAVERVLEKALPPSSVWVSMERNMQCANGRCGHCQFGPYFVCRDGPVFCYTEIADLLGVPGF